MAYLETHLDHKKLASRFPGRDLITGIDLWPNAPDGFEAVELVWTEIDGRSECVGLLILGDGSAPLTASSVRKLPLGSLILESRRRQLVGAKQAQNAFSDDPLLKQRVAKLGPRRRYTEEDYQLVADTYDEAMSVGLPPTAYVQKELGETLGLENRSQTGKLVARVRKAGLLPPTEQRVPKGNPE